MKVFHALVGSWGFPPDAVSWAALALAIVLAILAVKARNAWILIVPNRLFLAAVAIGAAALSAGYVVYYLRGAPRIIDATSYYLEARELSKGHFAWPTPEPSANFRGRFLIAHDGSIAGIFPPGYPLLLAFGFWIGAPMVIGPLLAAALVVVTYHLTKEFSESEIAARSAAVFSLLSAALRYHTADTMAHGATALWVAMAFLFALRARRTKSQSPLFVAGFALGMVVATRPISAIPIGLTIALILSLLPGKVSSFLRVAILALPGFALLLLSQYAATGSVTTSTQLAYYAASDGPPGCFRYGFGDGVGCLFEHGDFVRARLPNGYGFVPALGTTIRRLHLHLSDAFNAWPLFLGFVFLLPRGLRNNFPAKLGVLLVLLQIAAYAPFYFDGNYPAGGARFFADVIPVEHALCGMGLVSIVADAFAFRRTLAAMSLVLAGFSFHASFDHGQLQHREGGRPMWLDRDLANVSKEVGLVFLDTDHSFNLAHGSRPETVFARMHGDDHDRLLYDRLGKPMALTHHYDLASGQTTVSPITPAGDPDVWHFEAEAEWPPMAQKNAWAFPIWITTREGCASGGRALEISTNGERGEITLKLPIPDSGTWSFSPRLLMRGGGGKGTIRVADRVLAFRDEDRAGECVNLPAVDVTSNAAEMPVIVEIEGAPVVLDRLDLVRHEFDDPRL